MTFTLPRLTAMICVVSLLVGCGGAGSKDPHVEVAQEAQLANIAGQGQLMEAVLLKTVSTEEITLATALAGDAAFNAIPRYAP